MSPEAQSAVTQQDLAEFLLPGYEYEWLLEFERSLTSHIAYVREAGERLGVPPMQLALHDSSKFMLEEFPYYARQFHGDRGDAPGFARAWLHHQNLNAHHWEYWIMRSGHTFGGNGADEETGCLPMPHNDLLEMVADWMGASMAYTGSFSIREWYAENKARIRLHPQTQSDLAQILKRIRYGEA